MTLRDRFLSRTRANNHVRRLSYLDPLRLWYSSSSLWYVYLARHLWDGGGSLGCIPHFGTMCDTKGTGQVGKATGRGLTQPITQCWFLCVSGTVLVNPFEGGSEKKGGEQGEECEVTYASRFSEITLIIPGAHYHAVVSVCAGAITLVWARPVHNLLVEGPCFTRNDPSRWQEWQLKSHWLGQTWSLRDEYLLSISPLFFLFRDRTKREKSIRKESASLCRWK